MPVTWLCLFGLIYCAGIVSSSPKSTDVFTSSFLVRFKRNVDNDLAHLIADRNGFDNLGSVSFKIKKKIIYNVCYKKMNILHNSKM